jgi:hypothetical protein
MLKIHLEDLGDSQTSDGKNLSPIYHKTKDYKSKVYTNLNCYHIIIFLRLIALLDSMKDLAQNAICLCQLL